MEKSLTMRLSQILQSQSINRDGEEDGGGSWGIFMSPEDQNFVAKLFCNERQFIDEKTGYDKVLCEPELLQLANKYRVIAIHLDTSTYPSNRNGPPFKKALFLPFLSNPPWKNIGKLGFSNTDNMLAKCRVAVEKIKNEFQRIGLASWESTFFMHSNLRDIKALDFTYSKVVFNNYSEKNEGE
jgi:hypothetical protein